MSGISRYIWLAVVFAASVIVFQGVGWSAGGADNSNRKIVVFREDFRALPDQAALIRGAGGETIKALPFVNGFAARLPEAAAGALSRRAEVLRVDDDIVITASPRKNPPNGGGGGGGETPPPEVLPWGVDRVDADIVWGGAEKAQSIATEVTGEFVKVAVLDTGIDLNHPDLAVMGNVNFVNPRKSGNDDNGHGSHVAGIIAGVDNEQGVIGVAPRAYLYAVKVLDASGSGWLSDLVDGLSWCVNNGMDVVNMSLGASADNATFHQAIINTYNAGVTMAAAAGNTGSYGLDYPGRYAETIGVAATDANDNVAYYSSYGPQVDIAAPGSAVYSTYKRGGYATLSGTSMATPHVAGAAALVLHRYGPTSPDALKQHLKDTAKDIRFSADRMGAGLVDAQYAVDVAP